MIIGLGTGRCGTMSLSAVLGLPHEQSVMPWKQSHKQFDASFAAAQETCGDVGYYWLNYIDLLVKQEPGVKCVCIKRDKQGTVDSWFKHTSGVNHFDPDNKRVLPVNVLSVRQRFAFPVYPDVPVKECWGLYWDEYYAFASVLETLYPEQFRVFDMDSILNTVDGQLEMWKWIGLDALVRIGCRKNQFIPKVAYVPNRMGLSEEEFNEVARIAVADQLMVGGSVYKNERERAEGLCPVNP